MRQHKQICGSVRREVGKTEWKDDQFELAGWSRLLGVRFRTLLGTEVGNCAGREFSLENYLMEWFLRGWLRWGITTGDTSFTRINQQDVRVVNQSEAKTLRCPSRLFASRPLRTFLQKSRRSPAGSLSNLVRKGKVVDEAEGKARYPTPRLTYI